MKCAYEAIIAKESTDAEMIESINKDVTDADEGQHAEEQFIDEAIVLIKAAKSALNTLRVFAKRSDNVDDEVFSALVLIDNAIDSLQSYFMAQTKITNYFRPKNSLN